jgi:hypothetical protein
MSGQLSSGERVALADGAQIVIRPVEPGDVRDLAAGFDRLGALSRFRLLGARVDDLTRYELAERLAGLARAAGIDRCCAELVLGNAPARRLLAHVADEVDERRDGGTVDVTAQARRTTP